MGLASGFAPLTYIDNSTSAPLNYCIRVLSDGGLDPVFTGRNVSCCCVLVARVMLSAWSGEVLAPAATHAPHCYVSGCPGLQQCIDNTAAVIL